MRRGETSGVDEVRKGSPQIAWCRAPPQWGTLVESGRLAGNKDSLVVCHVPSTRVEAREEWTAPERLLSWQHKLLVRNHALCPAHLRPRWAQAMLSGPRQLQSGSRPGHQTVTEPRASTSPPCPTLNELALKLAEGTKAEAGGRPRQSSQRNKGWDLGPAPCVSWGKLARDARIKRSWLHAVYLPSLPPVVKGEGYVPRTMLLLSWYNLSLLILGA